MSMNLPMKMRKQFSEIYIENFAIASRVEATREICQGASEAISQVTSRETYLKNEQFCSF